MDLNKSKDFSIFCEQTGLTYDKDSFDSKSLYAINSLIKNNLVKRKIKFLVSSELTSSLIFIWQGILLSGNHLIIAERSLFNNIVSSNEKNEYDFIITDSLVSKNVDNLIYLKDIKFPKNAKKIKDNKILDSKITTFTSGTTSEPKKITRSYKIYRDASIDFVEHLALPEDNIKTIATFSGMYLGGVFNLFILPYVNGWDLIIPKIKGIFFWSNLSEYIKEYNLNLVWLTPGIINTLLKIKLNLSTIDKGKLFFLSGTDYLSRNIWNEFRQNFTFPLLNTYGLSETLFISAQKLDEEEYSTGTLLKGNNITLKKVDKIMVKVKSDKSINNDFYELLVKTPYLSEEIIKESDEDFLNTGDVIDESQVLNRKINIVGRSKDIIIRGGINISPNYIEAIISSFEEIKECSVFPIPNKIYGELIGCSIVPINKLINKNKLKKIFMDKIPKQFMPDEINLIDKLPKTISGKVIKSKLLDNVIY